MGKRWLARLLGILVPTIACLLLVEMGDRLLNDVALLSFTNFRNTRVTVVNLSDASRYDPVLGWALKDDLRPSKYSSMTTTAFGVRRNSPEQQGIRPGHILVVGSSFTAGSGVADDQTWPAQLEQLIGQPVDNAAVGGYAMDQVVLRAEQLLAPEHPKFLLVEVMDASIAWTRYAVDPRPKPYYTVESDKLVEHNIPVPLTVSETDRWDKLKTALGYSYVIDRLMTRFDPYGWFGTGGKAVRTVQNDGVDVTCRLLLRLKRETDDAHIRSVLFANFAAQEIAKSDAPPPDVVRVEDCARSVGYQIVDDFKELRRQYEADPSVLSRYFPLLDGVYGHPTACGHLTIAHLFAAVFAEPSAKEDAATRVGGGQNLVPCADHIDVIIAPNPVAVVSEDHSSSGTLHQFKLAATGGESAHYVVVSLSNDGAAAYTLSADITAVTPTQFMVQMHDSDKDGIIGGYDLKSGVASVVSTLGRMTKANATIEPEPDGWVGITLTGTLAAGDTTIFLQLVSQDGKTVFPAHGEAILFRNLRVEHGESHARE